MMAPTLVLVSRQREIGRYPEAHRTLSVGSSRTASPREVLASPQDRFPPFESHPFKVGPPICRQAVKKQHQVG